jgi:hypothetical protein
MEMPYGASGEIVPALYKGLDEVFYDQDGIEIAVKDGVVYVGVVDKSQLERATV